MLSHQLSIARTGYNLSFKTTMSELLPSDLSIRDGEAYAATVEASRVWCCTHFDTAAVDTEVSSVSPEITTEQWHTAIENGVASWYKHVIDLVPFVKGDMAMRHVLLRAVHILNEMKIVAATNLVNTHNLLENHDSPTTSELNCVSPYASTWCSTISDASVAWTTGLDALSMLITTSDERFKMKMLLEMFARFSHCLMHELSVLVVAEIRTCENVGDEFWSMAILFAAASARKSLYSDKLNDAEKRIMATVRPAIRKTQVGLFVIATKFDGMMPTAEIVDDTLSKSKWCERIRRALEGCDAFETNDENVGRRYMSTELTKLCTQLARDVPGTAMRYLTVTQARGDAIEKFTSKRHDSETADLHKELCDFLDTFSAGIGWDIECVTVYDDVREMFVMSKLFEFATKMINVSPAFDALDENKTSDAYDAAKKEYSDLCGKTVDPADYP